MNQNWEVVEPCPYCGHDNLWENLDPVANGYVAVCQECGEEIMLCDECLHSDDNPDQKCDWQKCDGCKGGTCFRRRNDGVPDAQTLCFDTYPDVFINYETHEENPDYDTTLKVFDVPADWAVKWIHENMGMDMIEFLNTYTWDDTLSMHDAAVTAGAILSERTADR